MDEVASAKPDPIPLTCPNGRVHVNVHYGESPPLGVEYSDIPIDLSDWDVLRAFR